MVKPGKYFCCATADICRSGPDAMTFGSQKQETLRLGTSVVLLLLAQMHSYPNDASYNTMCLVKLQQ